MIDETSAISLKTSALQIKACNGLITSVMMPAAH
jgi:hypothetical protein